VNAFSRFLFQIACVIAGRRRRDWIDAMATEAVAIDGNSTGWAIGCLSAAIKDRLAREWQFVLAIPLLSIGAVLLSLALFYPMAWLFTHGWIAGWVFVSSGLLSPLPFAFILGRMRPGRTAYLAALISFVLEVFIPLTIFWAMFGKSPFSWFSEDATWYMMTPAAGLSSALLVWLIGVWLGSRWRRTET